MSDNLSIAPNRGHGSDDGKRSIISKESLVPLGVVVGACFMIFQAAVQWTTLQLRVTQTEALNARHERRIDNLEASMVFWRREVERKVGPLPDYKPGAMEDRHDEAKPQHAVVATKQEE